MKYLTLSFLILLTVLTEAAFLPPLGTNINLLLVILLGLLFLKMTNEAYFGAFFGGLLLDLLATGIFGFSSLALLLIVGAVGYLRKILPESFWFWPPLTFLAAAVFRRGDFKAAAGELVAMIVLFPVLKWTLPQMLAGKERKYETG